MSAIVHRKTTPVCFQQASKLADMDPCWGISPVTDCMIVLPDGFRPPGMDVLATMEQELQMALVPCGMAQAAKAAAVMIGAYPQADNTSAAYAQHVARRLAECPADLLDHVVDRILDNSPDFRPAPGRVADAVRREVAKRGLLLRRVQAARRWWGQQAAAAAQAEEVRADKAAAIERLTQAAAGLARSGEAILDGVRSLPNADVIDMAGRGQLRIGPRAAPLAGEDLIAARQRAGIPTPAIPQEEPPSEG